MSENNQVFLSDLLWFWTASQGMPGINDEILLVFPSEAESFALPIANTCFNQLTIPTRYDTYKEFVTKMDVALKYGAKGFSEV
jgi:hypothetical protein